MNHAIRQVFNKFGGLYLSKYTPNYDERKVYNKIKICKTHESGTRIYKCETCGHKIFTYNSCRDRHCPNCQDYQKEVWIEKHKRDILDITYYHVVTTVPAELHVIFYHNKKKMYNLLFKASSETIMELCADEKYLGAKVGITSMIHTWSQKALYHPHIHMIVTGGGIDKYGKWVNSKNNYFLPVKVISRKFRGKLLSIIKEEKLKFYGDYEYLNDKKELNKYLSKLYKKEWVCYSKRPFQNVGKVYEYLGRYAFRVCMSNERIAKITKTHVYFKYKDRLKNNEEKIMKVKGEEFIRKFLMHTLPHSFMKIRHYGLFAGKGRNNRIRKLQILTKTKRRIEDRIDKISLLNKMTGKDVTKCPKCNGALVITLQKFKTRPPDIIQKVRKIRNA